MFGANQKAEVLKAIYTEAESALASWNETIEIVHVDLLKIIDDDIRNLNRATHIRQLLNQLEIIKLKAKMPSRVANGKIDSKIQTILNEALLAAIDKDDSSALLLLLQYGANPNFEKNGAYTTKQLPHCARETGK